MAQGSGQSKLFQKYGNKLDKSVKSHAGDETKKGPEDLPPGIRDGICQLKECGFKEYGSDTNMRKADGTSAKGEFYFYAVGVLIEPEFVDVNGRNVKVAGRQTRILVNMFDTKSTAGKITTQDDSITKVLNHMRLLGGDEYTAGATGADLENLAAGLQEAKPYFKFSTSVRKGQKKANGEMGPDGVWENWNGIEGLEDYQAPDGSSHVEDDTGSSNDTGSDNQDGEDQDTSSSSSDNDNSSNDEPDLDALASAADDDDDQSAKDKLEELAEAAGIKKLKNGDFPGANWKELADLIKEKQGEGSSEPEQDKEYIPEKEETCKYTTFIDPKNQKKGKKPQDCVITAVDKKKKTVTLKNVDTKAVYTAVSWSEITPT